MFARRTPASLEPGPWARRHAALITQGRPLLDLTEPNPTAAGLGYLDSPPYRAAFASLAGHAATPYVPDAAGDLTAREAIAAYYADHGARVDPARIVLTSGTSESYADLFRLLCEPGDPVLVPSPGYPLFEPIAQAEGVRAAAWSGAPDHAFDGEPRARALVVVHPSHPEGLATSRSEAAALAAACRAKGAALVADEVFLDHVPEGALVPQSFAAMVGEDGPLLFVLSGLSKVCGLPQMKLGWIVVGGDPALAREAHERLAWLRDTFLSVAQPVARAVPAFLAARGVFHDAVRARVAANRARLEALPPGARVVSGRYGTGAVLALDGARTDEEWALALLEHDVVVHPGYFYDFAEPGRIVVSLLPRPEVFDEALARLAAVLR